MPMYRLADLIVSVEGAGEYTLKQMEDYRCTSPVKIVPQIRVEVTKAMTLRERALEGDGFSDEYLECIAVYRAYCEQALLHDVLFFHASALAKDGGAYLFAGKSGAGKSTHTRMWRETFGSSVTIINDDKPLIRFVGGVPYVYGTPWDGKDHLNTNIKMPVRGIAFLEKADTCRIDRLCYTEGRRRTLEQLFRPARWEQKQQNVMCASRLVNTVPMYRLACDISAHAAVLAYETMSRG